MKDQDLLFRAAINEFDVNALNYFIQGVKIDATPDALTNARLNEWNNAVRSAICKLTIIQQYLTKMEGSFGPYTYPLDSRVSSGMEKACTLDPTHINHSAAFKQGDLV